MSRDVVGWPLSLPDPPLSPLHMMPLDVRYSQDNLSRLENVVSVMRSQ